MLTAVGRITAESLGTLLTDTPFPVDHGTVVEVRCGTGFILDGDSEIACRKGTAFTADGQMPSCKTGKWTAVKLNAIGGKLRSSVGNLSRAWET